MSLDSYNQGYENVTLDHPHFMFIVPERYGFSCSRSTMYNLQEYQEYFMLPFVESCQVDYIYLDLSKSL